MKGCYQRTSIISHIVLTASKSAPVATPVPNSGPIPIATDKIREKGKKCYKQSAQVVLFIDSRNAPTTCMRIFPNLLFNVM
jgi:hypothetical protein